MEKNQINEELLSAYIKGELSQSDASRVEDWYDASPQNRKMLGDVYYLLFLNDRITAAQGVDVERSLSQLKARIDRRRRQTTSLRRPTWRIAAMAMVAVVVMGFVWGAWMVSEQLAGPVTICTKLGERSQVTLPDGTKVWLNSCSRVEYSSSLFSRKRLVTMDGEAYFEVAHNKHSPFIVTADGLAIRVLGTRFNIRCDEQRDNVTTVLLAGSVMAYDSEQESNSCMLKPSQSVVFNTKSKQMELMNCPEAENSIQWIEGRLHFDHMPFSEIAQELQRYFNVNIIFKDEALKRESFSGDFSVSDGIYHIISVLGLTYKFQYKIVDNDIILLDN